MKQGNFCINIPTARHGRVEAGEKCQGSLDGNVTGEGRGYYSMFGAEIEGMHVRSWVSGMRDVIWGHDTD